MKTIIGIIIFILILYAFIFLLRKAWRYSLIFLFGHHGYKNYPELIPSNQHYKNVRAVLEPEEWKRVAKVVYKQAGYKCEVCGSSGKRQGFPHPVEAHEVWKYDENKEVQSLVRIQALCPMCHKVKHHGLAYKQGYGEAVNIHMARVNNISRAKAKQAIFESIDTVKRRGFTNYQLDLRHMNRYKSLFNSQYKFTGNDEHLCDRHIGEA